MQASNQRINEIKPVVWQYRTKPTWVAAWDHGKTVQNDKLLNTNKYQFYMTGNTRHVHSA